MIFRVNKNKGYTVMSNVHLQDCELSLKAKGLLSLILSLPDDWKYSISGLSRFCKEGKTAIISGLKELKDCGYLVIKKIYPDETDSGRIEYEYNIYESPQAREAEKQGIEKQGVENLCLENLHLENPPLQSTNKQSTNKQSTNKQISKQIDDFSENEETRDLLREWLKIRKVKHCANTERAVALNLEKLNRVSEQSGLDVQNYLKEIIRRSWAAFYVIGRERGVADETLGNPPKYGTVL